MDSRFLKIAFSPFFNANIRCVKYVSDIEWYFVLLDNNRNPASRIYKAQTNYSHYKWKL